MINLLEANLTVDEIIAHLHQIKRQPLLSPMGAPEWQAAAQRPAVQKWLGAIRGRGQAGDELARPMLPLTDEMYAIFFKTGERLTFETAYFERRRILGRVAMMTLLADEADRPKLVPALIAKIEETMAEESWTFPAHVWEEPTGKDPMKIDLFASETANIMGDLVSVFGSVLPVELVDRIRHRIQVQYVRNYVEHPEKHFWRANSNNWNAVCHQGVIGATLALEDDPEMVGRMLALSVPCLQHFLTGFGNDGSTSEGPGYWSYGFGRFAELNAQLEAATGGELSFFGNNQKVRNIAAFAPALTFSNGCLVNFSDGHHRDRLGAALVDYLGRRLDLPSLRQEAATIYAHFAQEGLDLQGQRADFFYYSRLFLTDVQPLPVGDAPLPPDIYFPDYGAVVSRLRDAKGNLWEFAAKGGHNNEHHNQNDCGSYLLNLNGQPAIIEIGASEYTRPYFGPERYTFLATRSLGHSVPYVNGSEQPEGEQFAAKVLECRLEPERLTFAVDLTKCYPPEARLKSLTRTFVFEKSAGRIEITDAFELEEPGPVESLVIVQVPVVPKAGTVEIQLSSGVLVLTPAKGATISPVEVCDYSDHWGKPRHVNRLRFSLPELATSGVIRYDLQFR